MKQIRQHYIYVNTYMGIRITYYVYVILNWKASVHSMGGGDEKLFELRISNYYVYGSRSLHISGGGGGVDESRPFPVCPFRDRSTKNGRCAALKMEKKRKTKGKNWLQWKNVL